MSSVCLRMLRRGTCSSTMPCYACVTMWLPYRVRPGAAMASTRPCTPCCTPWTTCSSQTTCVSTQTASLQPWGSGQCPQRSSTDRRTVRAGPRARAAAPRGRGGLVECAGACCDTSSPRSSRRPWPHRRASSRRKPRSLHACGRQNGRRGLCSTPATTRRRQGPHSALSPPTRVAASPSTTIGVPMPIRRCPARARSARPRPPCEPPSRGNAHDVVTYASSSSFA
mmetsp:Transcript_30421/g.81816  ORF Transcript_30421/g.81816 Transcript_30421/m.81816 type:complete len:225 (+) Transcript_30421:989-1663(+)